MSLFSGSAIKPETHSQTGGAQKHSLDVDDVWDDERDKRSKRLHREHTPADSKDGHPVMKQEVLADDDQEVPTATQADQENVTTVIAPKGRLMVIVGPRERRFKVHALVLTMCSRVLERIIASAGEAPVLQDTHEIEIKLPVDDAEAFKIFALHLQMSTLDPLSLAVDVVEKVAILTKKYKCTEKFRYTADYWMRELRPTVQGPAGRSIWALILAAFLFDNAEGFQFFSASLVERYARSYLAFTGGCHDPLLQMKLALALQEKRTETRPNLEKKLPSNPEGNGLCLGCFRDSQKSFSPNAHCPSCSQPQKEPTHDDSTSTALTPSPAQIPASAATKNNAIARGSFFGGGSKSHTTAPSVGHSRLGTHGYTPVRLINPVTGVPITSASGPSVFGSVPSNSQVQPLFSQHQSGGTTSAAASLFSGSTTADRHAKLFGGSDERG